MSRPTATPLSSIAAQFQIGGPPQKMTPFGNGHIHDTFVSRVTTSAGPKRFIHQRINQKVFDRPHLLMQNITRIVDHLRRRVIGEGGNPDQECLTIVPSVDGDPLFETGDGECWRTYHFMEGVRSYEWPPTPAHLRSAARAFARFALRLQDLPGDPLHVTIRGFGDGIQRMDRLRQVLQTARPRQLKDAEREIEFAREHEALAKQLTAWIVAKDVPLRIVHHDTKFNNVLMDEECRRPACVIDLDTVMPGTLLYDFGDMVRTGVILSAEDDPDAIPVGIDLDLFAQVTKGYLEGGREGLLQAEIDRFARAAISVAFVMGIRFLTDYLSGDAYFKIRYQGQNLARCRTQFALAAEMLRIEDQLSRIVQWTRAI